MQARHYPWARPGLGGPSLAWVPFLVGLSCGLTAVAQTERDAEPRSRAVLVTPIPIGTAARLPEEPAVPKPPERPATRITLSSVPPAAHPTGGSAGPGSGDVANSGGSSIPQLEVPGRAGSGRRATGSGPTPLPPPKKGSKPMSIGSLPAASYPFGLTREEEDRGGIGPGPASIQLAESLLADVPLDLGSLLPLFPLVYQDLNPASGIFYYLPAAYRLGWSRDTGYDLRFLFLAAGEGQTAGDVLLRMKLQAGVSPQDVTLARKLLDAHAARNRSITVTQLRILPISAPPEVSLSATLERQFDIAPDGIVVNAASDSLAAIDLSVTTDSVTKENLQLVLEQDLGLGGRVVLHPYGEGLPAQEVPVEVRLTDPRTLGRQPWERGRRWVNPAPYPVRLRYLHVLLLDEGTPVIYSWDLGETWVDVRGVAVIDPRPIPRWLDERAERMWLDYTVSQDCDACDERVMEEITGGVASVSASAITVRVLRPLVDTGAIELVLKVRSRFFHPRDREMVEKPLLRMGEDGGTHSVGPIYRVRPVEEEEEQPGPLFEYKLDLLMPDGRFYRSPEWIPAEDTYLPIGTVQVEQALGFLPGHEDQPAAAPEEGAGG